MNRQVLSGLVVLITRPANQARVMEQAVAAAGASYLTLPLIEIKPLSEADGIQELRDKVLNLDNYARLIFVSNNAVNFGGEVINDYWPQFPVGVQVVAIGPSTAAAAREKFSCEVTCGESGMTSEDILRLPQLLDVADSRVGIVRGIGGRELLADTLRERGAVVDYLECYSREPVLYQSSAFCESLRAAGVNVITVSSGESLDKLTALLADNTEFKQQMDLLVPSQRVAEQAEAAGYSKVHNVHGADPASFVEALGELHSNPE